MYNLRFDLISLLLCFTLRRMPLVQDIVNSRYFISGYQENAVMVNNTAYRKSLILAADYLHHPWVVNHIDDLNDEQLQLVFSLKPDVVLLGTGIQQQFPAARVRACFGQKGIGLEVMGNGALCRTFNILVAENRAVVAAILLNN